MSQQDYLSQEEIDALLKGTPGTSEEVPNPPAADVRPYDLGQQERTMRGHLPVLELINERFARHLRNGLSNYLHRSTAISTGPLRAQKYGEFTAGLAVPANLNLVQIAPLQGTALVVLDANLVFLVIDNLFGSDGRFHTPIEGRDFTPTELGIVRGLLGVVFAAYEQAWRPDYEIRCEYVRAETHPQFASIAAATEIVLTATFTIELSGNPSAMHLCLPYTMLEPIRALLTNVRKECGGDERRWANLLRQQLLSAEVELVAPLGSADLSLGAVTRLKVGDIVPLDVATTLDVTVDGVPLLACRYGINNGQYALRVESFLASGEAVE